MSLSTLVEAAGDGPVVVKRATSATATKLRMEGERLQRASHPGVVQVLSCGPVEDGWELRTAHAGRPLSALARPTLRQTAALIAATASTLADLHQLGVVHGRLDATHILVGDQGRPVLCGFGDGSSIARPEDDVAGLGSLLGELIGGEAEAEPIPERRWRRRRTWSGWDRRCLLLLADQACAEPATRRPTARRLAAAIADAVPDLTPVVPSCEVPSGDATAPREPVEPDGLGRLRTSRALIPQRRSRRPSPVWLAAAGVTLVVLGVVRWGEGSDGEGPTEGSVTDTSFPDDRQTSTALEDSVLEVDGRRFRVGQSGDEVLVGDWNCDGTATPALLRPATGEVFVFPRWAVRSELAVEPALRVVDAEGLSSDPTSGGCPSLAVETADGDLVPVTDEVIE